MKLEELRGKSILIVGFGKEGQDAFGFLKKRLPRQKIAHTDQKQGRGYLSKIGEYDVVVKSPGIALSVLKPRVKRRQQLTSPTNIFFANFPGTVIGITGTKGKSTTAALLHHVLKKGGVEAKLAGNIGEPLLSLLEKAGPKDLVVAELSSFQLELLRQSPHIAVLLNVYPEHLDHHGSFARYAWAKANIARFQTSGDFLIYNKTNKAAAGIAKLSKAKKLPYAPRPGQENTSKFLTPVEPVLLAAKLFGVSAKKTRSAFKTFKPLPHRLERVGTYKGIAFVNDSLATVPEATIAALDTIGTQAAALITGGHDRGVDMKKLARRIEESAVQTLILFPDTGRKILRSLKKKPRNVFEVKTMKEAVRLAFGHTPRGKTCLLSPAASSFNLFADYADRGEQFTTYVKRYGTKQA